MKALAHPYLSSKEHTWRKTEIEPPWSQEVESMGLFNVYTFDLRDLYILSSSLSEPR